MPYEVKAKLKLVEGKYVPMYTVIFSEPTMPTIELGVDIFDPLEARDIVKAHVAKRKFIKQYGSIFYDDDGNRLNSLNDGDQDE